MSTWLRSGNLMATVITHSGHRRLKLSAGTRRGTFLVHRLVASAFLGLSDAPLIRHLDGDPLNNVPSNLSAGTQSDNMQDAVRHGTHAWARKTHCPLGHPYSEENTLRQKSGSRQCRTCKADKQRTRRALVRHENSEPWAEFS